MQSAEADLDLALVLLTVMASTTALASSSMMLEGAVMVWVLNLSASSSRFCLIVLLPGLEVEESESSVLLL